MDTLPIVIDARGHLVGRLAALVAKSLLQGQRMVILRCEGLNYSGSFYRNKLKAQEFLRKRMNTNPSRGPFHFRAPSKMFWRVVRGMLPHKTKRGALALERMKVFEGVPPEYQKVQRKVVPSCLKVLRLKSRRKFCTLGRIAHETGWKYQDVVETLENKRKARSAEHYNQKKKDKVILEAAKKSAASKLAPHQKIIESYGFN